ncbi:phospholipase A2, membrane associated-like [Myotis daubentonii]|uniref:phospholipase A2, membrane associated-like n=1 Tax=Myotis daubentonii TaxID=98922 RepID=UPI0028730282|nr:phospholipase A2, membrane associated-like [Myotis daubentonii]XP_059546952.1 phospholipase A2, membrane associated-like [Myotis daubentonii]XP_059546953.1 phospholipase A2, membrane associated-like [Myotis daubentonii]XP_059546954.1 phospholipase A2, membrane associated-like [Myotis daubentonii]XP_059546955.1 phospholipase A2, membrane associated-like [Myotis daubentonii]
MKTLLWLALIMAFGLLQTHGSLLGSLEMIEFKTGKDAFFGYVFYGCYCWSGGQGTPKDATDRCCAEHDCCYERLQKEKSCSKFLTYYFTYENGQIICGEQDYCRRQLCECNKAAADCFARNLNTYNTQYQFHYNKQCDGRDYQCLPPLEV